MLNMSAKSLAGGERSEEREGGERILRRRCKADLNSLRARPRGRTPRPHARAPARHVRSVPRLGRPPARHVRIETPLR